MNRYQKLITLLSLLVLLTSCKKESESIDADVIILRTFKSIEFGGSAAVRYKLMNIGNDDIRGWNIYFRVSMKSGKQVQAHHGLTYDLVIGETSEELLAVGKIPDHYDDTDEPTSASLQRIEAY